MRVRQNPVLCIRDCRIPAMGNQLHENPQRGTLCGFWTCRGGIPDRKNFLSDKTACKAWG